MINKRQFKKVNDKKVLHKVKKQWVTVSLALLMAIGGSAVVASANTTNASTQSSNAVNHSLIMTKSNNPSNVTKSTSNKSSLLSEKVSYSNIDLTSQHRTKTVAPNQSQQQVANNQSNTNTTSDNPENLPQYPLPKNDNDDINKLSSYPKPKYSHQLNEYHFPVNLVSIHNGQKSTVPYMIMGKEDKKINLPNGETIEFHKDNRGIHMINTQGRPLTNNDIKQKVESTPIPESFNNNINNFSLYNINPLLQFTKNDTNHTPVSHYHHIADNNGFYQSKGQGVFRGFKGEIIHIPISQIIGQLQNGFSSLYPYFAPDVSDLPYDSNKKQYYIPIALGDGISNTYNDINQSYWPKGNIIPMRTQDIHYKLNYNYNGKSIASKSGDSTSGKIINALLDFQKLYYKPAYDKYGHLDTNNSQEPYSNYFNVDLSSQNVNGNPTKYQNKPVTLRPIGDNSNHPTYNINVNVTPQPYWQTIPIELVNKDKEHHSDYDDHDYPSTTQGYFNVFGNLNSQQSFYIFPTNIYTNDNQNNPLKKRSLISSGSYQLIMGKDKNGKINPENYHWTTNKTAHVDIDKSNGELKLYYTDANKPSIYKSWPELFYNYRKWTINDRTKPDVYTKYVTEGDIKDIGSMDNENKMNLIDNNLNAQNFYTGQDWVFNTPNESPNGSIIQMNPWGDSGFKWENNKNDNNDRYIQLTTDNNGHTIVKELKSDNQNWNDSNENHISAFVKENGQKKEHDVSYWGFAGNNSNNFDIAYQDGDNYYKVKNDKVYDKNWNPIRKDGNQITTTNIKDYDSRAIPGYLINPKDSDSYDSAMNTVFVPNGSNLLVNSHPHSRTVTQKLGYNSYYYVYNNGQYYVPDWNSKSAVSQPDTSKKVRFGVVNNNLIYKGNIQKSKNNSNAYYLGSENEYAISQPLTINLMKSGNKDKSVDDSYIFQSGDINTNNNSFENNNDNVLTTDDINATPDIFDQNQINKYGNGKQYTTKINVYSGDSISLDTLPHGKKALVLHTTSGNTQEHNEDHPEVLLTIPNNRVYNNIFQQYYNQLVYTRNGSGIPEPNDYTWIFGNHVSPYGYKDGNSNLQPNVINLYTADNQIQSQSNVVFINSVTGEQIANQDTTNNKPQDILLTPNATGQYDFDLKSYLQKIDNNLGKTNTYNTPYLVKSLNNNPNDKEYIYISLISNPPVASADNTTYVFLTDFDEHNPSNYGLFGKTNINYINQFNPSQIIHTEVLNGQYKNQINQPEATALDTIDKSLGQYGSYNNHKQNNQLPDNLVKYNNPQSLYDYNKQGYHEIGIQLGKYENNGHFDSQQSLNNDYNNPIFKTDKNIFGVIPDITVILAQNPKVQPYYVDYADNSIINGKTVPYTLKKMNIQPQTLTNTTVDSHGNAIVNKAMFGKQLSQYQTVNDKKNNLYSEYKQNINNMNNSNTIPVYVTAPNIKIHYRMYNYGKPQNQLDGYGDIKGSKDAILSNPTPDTPINITNYNGKNFENNNFINKYLPNDIGSNFKVVKVWNNQNKFGYKHQLITILLAHIKTVHINYIDKNKANNNILNTDTLTLVDGQNPLKYNNKLVNELNILKQQKYYYNHSIISNIINTLSTLNYANAKENYNIPVDENQQQQFSTKTITENISYSFNTNYNTSNISAPIHFPSASSQSAIYYNQNNINEITNRNNYGTWQTTNSLKNITVPSFSGWHASIPSSSNNWIINNTNNSTVDAPKISSAYSASSFPTNTTNNITVTYYPDSYSDTANAQDNVIYNTQENNHNVNQSNSTDNLEFIREEKWTSGMNATSYSAGNWKAKSTNSFSSISNNTSFSNHYYRTASNASLPTSSEIIKSLSSGSTTNYSNSVTYNSDSSKAYSQGADVSNNISYIYKNILGNARISSASSSNDIHYSRSSYSDIENSARSTAGLSQYSNVNSWSATGNNGFTSWNNMEQSLADIKNNQSDISVNVNGTPIRVHLVYSNVSNPHIDFSKFSNNYKSNAENDTFVYQEDSYSNSNQYASATVNIDYILKSANGQQQVSSFNNTIQFSRTMKIDTADSADNIYPIWSTSSSFANYPASYSNSNWHVSFSNIALPNINTSNNGDLSSGNTKVYNYEVDYTSDIKSNGSDYASATDNINYISSGTNNNISNSTNNTIIYSRADSYNVTKNIHSFGSWNTNSQFNSISVPNNLSHLSNSNYHYVSGISSTPTVNTNNLRQNSNIQYNNNLYYNLDSYSKISQHTTATEKINYILGNNTTPASTFSTSITYYRDELSDENNSNDNSYTTWSTTSKFASLPNSYSSANWHITHGNISNPQINANNLSQNSNSETTYTVNYTSDNKSNGYDYATARDNIYYNISGNSSSLSSSFDVITYSRADSLDTTKSVHSYGSWSTASNFDNISVPNEFSESQFKDYHLINDNTQLPNINTNSWSSGTSASYSNQETYSLDSYQNRPRINTVNETINYINSKDNQILSSSTNTINYTRSEWYDTNYETNSLVSAGSWSTSGSLINSSVAGIESFSKSSWHLDVNSTQGSFPNSISAGASTNYSENVYYEPDSINSHNQYAKITENINYIYNLPTGVQSSSITDTINYYRSCLNDPYTGSFKSDANGNPIYSQWIAMNNISTPSNENIPNMHITKNTIPTNNQFTHPAINNLQPNSTENINYEVDYAPNSNVQITNTNERVNYYINNNLVSYSNASMHFSRNLTSDINMQNGISAGSWSTSGNSISPTIINSIANSMTNSLGYNNYHYTINGYMPTSIASGTNSNYIKNVYIKADNNIASYQNTAINENIDYILNGQIFSSATQIINYQRSASYNTYTDKYNEDSDGNIIYSPWSATNSISLPTSALSANLSPINSNISTNYNSPDSNNLQPNSTENLNFEVDYKANNTNNNNQLTHTINYLDDGHRNKLIKSFTISGYAEDNYNNIPYTNDYIDNSHIPNSFNYDKDTTIKLNNNNSNYLQTIRYDNGTTNIYVYQPAGQINVHFKYNGNDMGHPQIINDKNTPAKAGDLIPSSAINQYENNNYIKQTFGNYKYLNTTSKVISFSNQPQTIIINIVKALGFVKVNYVNENNNMIVAVGTYKAKADTPFSYTDADNHIPQHYAFDRNGTSINYSNSVTPNTATVYLYPIMPPTPIPNPVPHHNDNSNNKHHNTPVNPNQPVNPTPNTPINPNNHHNNKPNNQPANPIIPSHHNNKPTNNNHKHNNIQPIFPIHHHKKNPVVPRISKHKHNHNSPIINHYKHVIHKHYNHIPVIHNLNRINNIKPGHSVKYHHYNIRRVRHQSLYWFYIIHTCLAHTKLFSVGDEKDYDYVLHPGQTLFYHINRIFIIKGHHKHYVRFEFRTSFNGKKERNYFVTGNSYFTRNSYVQPYEINRARRYGIFHKYYKVHMIHDCILYNHLLCKPKDKIRDVSAGENFKVKKLRKIGYDHQTRFELTNGDYITANKNYAHLVKY